tara:strand:+ start:608 stop:949 length:342 start_codon:yes stop_codon:yes gene_type:complete
MASWEVPHDWSAGNLAATSSASATANMNAQVRGNMDWLATSHHHSGGTDGNSGLGPVAFVDIARGASPSSAGAGTLRSWATAAVHSAPNAQYYFFAGATAVVQLIDTSHSHGY